MDDIGSATNAVALTTHDANPQSPIPRALFVGTGGNLVLRAQGSGADVTLKNIPSGTLLPIRAQYVRATNTTAADIVALF